jgi:hypothetical protein
MSDKKTYRARLTLDVPMTHANTDKMTKTEVAASMIATFVNVLRDEPETFAKYFKVTDITEETK